MTYVTRFKLLRNNTLHIINSTHADEGSYVCRAENQFGSAEMTTRLLVKGKWFPLNFNILPNLVIFFNITYWA